MSMVWPTLGSRTAKDQIRSGVHANCFVRLRNLGKACGVIVSAAAVTK